MQMKPPGFANFWRVAGMSAATVVALGVVGFYAGRLGMPLPIFAPDEGAYLINALYAPELVARNPYVAAVANGVPLSLVRIAYNLGDHYIVWHRLADAAIYLAGLAALWWSQTAQLARRERWALLLIAVGFPYYRFAFSNLPEGLFVAEIALIGVVTARLYQTRPIAHAVLAGGLAAMLVLTKPHGVATIGALGAVAALEAVMSRRPGLLALRVGLFAGAFFLLGNLIQWRAGEPVATALTFFVGNFYSEALSVTAPADAPRIAAQALGAMASAMAVLAGIPLVIGLSDLARRWRAAPQPLTLDGHDLAFLLFVAALAATLPMVAIFTTKIAGIASETGRMWGRYFEFFAPLLWLAAAPALARYDGVRDGRTRLATAGVMLAGLAGLMLSFRAGIVLFPWDSSALTAFFAADPVRAPLGDIAPYRGAAILATLLAAAAIVLGARPASIGVGHILAIGVLSTSLDHVWVGPMLPLRGALEHDALVIRPQLPKAAGVTVLLAPNANEGHLAFLRLRAKPRVVLGPPGNAPLADLLDAQAVIVAGPQAPPGGPWKRRYTGTALSLYEPEPAP